VTSAAAALRQPPRHSLRSAAFPAPYPAASLARRQSTRIVWARNTALAAALLGVLWFAFMGRLLSFDLNY
jgi:hypothetical protein